MNYKRYQSPHKTITIICGLLSLSNKL